MRIESVYIENFQGLRHANLQLGTPITLVCGLNGVGKSSLRDAIALAFGEGARVQHKKDWAQLVTEGQKKGQIIIGHDGAASSITLPNGKGERAAIDGQEYLPFVLAPEAFARLDDKAKRSLLMSLTKASAKPQIIVEKLVARGADAAKVEKIKPLLLSGFAAAQEQAKTYTSESRGAWKAITGEAYGSEKAENWVVALPELPVPTQAELDKIMADHKKASADVEKGTKYLGELEAKQKAAGNHAARLAAAEELAGLLPRRQAKLEATTKDLEAWLPKLAEMEARLATLVTGVDGCDCPSCGTTLKIVGTKLELFQGLKADTKERTDLALEVTKAKTAVETLRRTQQNDMTSVAEAEAAQGTVTAIKAEATESADEDLMQRTVDALNACRLKADQLRAAFNARQELKTQAEKADDTTAKAFSYHSDVLDWSLIEKALAPDGIPGEILAGALAPVNDQLKRLCKLSGWAQMEIAADMAITAGGRLYQLLSESEKWRCDAHIALTIALLSGLKMVVLDRADVLLPAVRAKHLGMLQVLAKSGDIETAIVCGSLKEKPATLPPEFTAVWVENGLAGEPELQKAS